MIPPYESVHSDEESGHRGGAWKVAYADFITALMALFIVLWLLNSTREVREAVSGYFRDPNGQAKNTGSGRAGTGEALAVNRDSISELRRKLEQSMRDLTGFEKFAQYVQFTVTGEGLRIELMEKDDGMFFESGSPHPTDIGEQLFGALAGQLGSLPNLIAIEGHTDGRPFRVQEPPPMATGSSLSTAPTWPAASCWSMASGPARFGKSVATRTVRCSTPAIPIRAATGGSPSSSSIGDHPYPCAVIRLCAATRLGRPNQRGF